MPQSSPDPTGGATLLGDPGLAVDFVWVLISASLVMFMQAGFAMLEAGFSRAKNVVSVLAKNMLDYVAGSIVFFLVGFALLMGEDVAGLVGATGFLLLGDYYDVKSVLLFLFSLVFAGTAATIVSGAVAERTRLSAYVATSLLVMGLIYPIYGHWVWGGGWLSSSPFMKGLASGDPVNGYGALDFAGSGVVHAIGGFVALAAAMVVGPRIGRYDERGEPRPIPGHSMSLAVLGTLILWFGWFGFNGGSTLSARELRISVVIANTNLAAAAGALSAVIAAWRRVGKLDVGIMCNGAIAGLVAVTASAAWVAPWASLVIGFVGGLIAVYGWWWLERSGVDDVVGCIPVHGFAGVWGLLALGLFADGTYGVYTTEPPYVTGLLYGNPGLLVAQAIAAAALVAWAFPVSLAAWKLMSWAWGVRVPREEELLGLDVVEHALQGYPNFVYTEVVPFGLEKEEGERG